VICFLHIPKNANIFHTGWQQLTSDKSCPRRENTSFFLAVTATAELSKGLAAGGPSRFAIELLRPLLL